MTISFQSSELERTFDSGIKIEFMYSNTHRELIVGCKKIDLKGEYASMLKTMMAADRHFLTSINRAINGMEYNTVPFCGLWVNCENNGVLPGSHSHKATPRSDAFAHPNILGNIVL